MKSSRITTLLTTGVALAALTACGTNQTAKGVDQHAAVTLARIEALRSASTPTIELTDSRQKIQDAWVAGPVNTISIVKRPPQMDAQIDINSSTSITVLGALARIKMLTGLDVQVAPDVMTKPPAPFGNLFTGTVEELLQKLCISNKLSLRYAKDKTDLSDDAKGDLSSIADTVKQSQGSVRIVAYAGGTAEEVSVAKRTSLARALQIRAYLISKGVNQLNISVQALGNKVPNGQTERADIYVK